MKTILLSSLLILSFFNSGFSSHVTGAEVTYRIIDPATHTYEITLKAYMKCGSIDNPGGCDSWGSCPAGSDGCMAPGNTYIYIESSCGGCQQLIFTPNQATVSTVDPYCPEVNPSCTSGQYELYEEWVFKRNVQLPPCNDYVITYPTYARSGTITNIVNPTGNGTAVYATLNNSSGLINNSPEFNVKPLPFICLDGKVCFGNGSVEADGDSLVYRFVRPLNHAGANIVYNAPYDFENQLASSKPITVDPITGDVCLEPSALQVTVIAVEVAEYRNGVLIGTVMRDMQVTVVDCSREPPFPDDKSSTTDLPGQTIDSTFTVQACDNQDFCLTIPIKSTGTKADGSPVNITVNYQDQLPGGGVFTITNNGTPQPDVEVCWVPPVGASANNPHTFVLNMADDGCPIKTVNNQTIRIIVEPCPIFAEITPNDTICIDSCVDIEVFNIEGGIEPYLFEWSDPSLSGPGPHKICPTQSTTYSVRVYDNYGSPDTTLFYTVVVNPSPIASHSGDETICIYDTVMVIASGGIQYKWTPNIAISSDISPNPDFFPTLDQEYTLQVTDVNGCIDDTTLNIFVNPLPIPIFDNDGPICPGKTVNLSAQGGTSYSWEPSDSVSSPFSGITTATLFSTTMFTTTVTDANGCKQIDSIEVVVFDLPEVDAGLDIQLCDGDVVNLGATGASSYEWLPTTALSNPSIANPSASPSADITYTVTGTDANGCISTDEIYLQVFPTDFARIDPDFEICLGENKLIQALPANAATYKWTPSAGLSSSSIPNPIFFANIVGPVNYQVEITLANGCSDTETISIIVNDKPKISISPNAPEICLGEEVRLTATGASTYTWEPANFITGNGANSGIVDVSPDVTTEFTVTGTDSKGCVNTTTITVIVNGIPDAPLKDGEICIGESYALNATTTGGLTYTWSPTTGLDNPISPTPNASPNATTTYTVNITDINGCITNLPVQVIINPLPIVNAGPDIELCENESQYISGASGVGKIKWTPDTYMNNSFRIDPTITPSTQGTITYTLQVTDAKGCVNTDQMILTVNPLPTISVDNPNPSGCSYEQDTVIASGASIYNWSPPEGLNTTTGNTVIMFPDFNTTYQLEGIDANGCKNYVFIDFTVFADAVASHAPDPEICFGKSFTFQPAQEFSFEWSPAADLDNPNIQNPTASPQTTTEYTFITTTFDGCKDTGNVTLYVNTLPIVDAGILDTICVFDTIQIGGSPTATGVNPPFSYSWSPSISLVDGSVMNPMAFPSVLTNYTVVVTDAKGCLDSASKTLDVMPIPVANAGPDISICPEDSTVLNGSGVGTSGSYFWLPFTGLTTPNQAITKADPIATTQYTLQVTDQFGCINFDSMTLTVFPNAVADAGPDDEICIEFSTQLAASGGISFIWEPKGKVDNENIANPNTIITTTTVFTVEVTDNNGCVDTDSVTVVVHPKPTITLLQNDTSICEGDDLTLGANGGITYAWSPPAIFNNPTAQNPIATPLSDPTVVTVGVTDINGCFDDTTLTLRFYPVIDPLPNGVPWICPEDTTTLIAINGVFGYDWQPPYGIVGSNTNAEIVVTPDVTTTYTVHIIDMNACEREGEFTLNVYPEAKADIEISRYSLRGEAIYNGNIVIRGETFKLLGSGGVSYIWSPDSFLNSTILQNPETTPDTTILYYLDIVDENGCTARDSFLVEILDKSFVYAPSAFSPNGDGKNDKFKAVDRNDFDFERLEIYNRWGEKIFVGNSIDEGWDGTYEGVIQEIGTYVFRIWGTGTFGETVVQQGNLTLIR